MDISCTMGLNLGGFLESVENLCSVLLVTFPKLCNTKTLAPIAGFHLTSWRPCWFTLNKKILIISFVYCLLCLLGLGENQEFLKRKQLTSLN